WPSPHTANVPGNSPVRALTCPQSAIPNARFVTDELRFSPLSAHLLRLDYCPVVALTCRKVPALSTALEVPEPALRLRMRPAKAFRRRRRVAPICRVCV